MPHCNGWVRCGQVEVAEGLLVRLGGLGLICRHTNGFKWVTNRSWVLEVMEMTDGFVWRWRWWWIFVVVMVEGKRLGARI